MSFAAKTYHSQIFRNFKAIDVKDFRRVVHFYEQSEKSIMQLDFDEYFELVVAYTNALFEITEYRKHLLMANVVIENSISQNVTHINGTEIYRSTLFMKAASHYNLREYSKAKHVLHELLKMNPHDDNNRRFLLRVMGDDRPSYLRKARAWAVSLFLATAFIVCVEVLVIRLFYVEFNQKIEFARDFLFLLGIFLLASTEIFHRVSVYRRAAKLVEAIKIKKKFERHKVSN